MELVGRFDARVWVQSHNDVCAETVKADSVMELLMLGAACGETITLTAQGAQAEPVIKALTDLVGDRLAKANETPGLCAGRSIGLWITQR